MQILAGAVKNGVLVLNHSAPGTAKVDSVAVAASTNLVTVTFAPASAEPPVVVVSGVTSAATPFVADITNNTFIIGGSQQFHFIAVLK